MPRILLVALVFLTVAGASAAAATQDVASDTDFRGITSIRVTASPMSVDSIDCNLDANLLAGELQHQLAGDGLTNSTGLDTLAVITVLSTREAGSGPCTSAIMLGAYKKASFFDDQARWLRTGYVVVWQSALLFTSPADSHLALARDSLQQLGKAMLTEWQRANNPKSSAER